MQTQTNIALIPVEGDLDVRSVPALRRQIERLISNGCRRIVLNLAGSGYVDSAGMGLVLFEFKHMRRLGGLISLINVPPLAYRCFARLRMTDLVPISRSGEAKVVTSLDPSTLPLWRTTFRVRPGSNDPLGEARRSLTELLDDLPFTPDEAFDLTLAVGEALGNAWDHTSGDCVLVTVAAYPDRSCVDVADCGEGFESQEALDVTAANDGPDDEFAERGRGIQLMRLLADSVEISPKTSGQGTVVHLVKLFGAA